MGHFPRSQAQRSRDALRNRSGRHRTLGGHWCLGSRKALEEARVTRLIMQGGGYGSQAPGWRGRGCATAQGFATKALETALGMPLRGSQPSTGYFTKQTVQRK